MATYLRPRPRRIRLPRLSAGRRPLLGRDRPRPPRPFAGPHGDQFAISRQADTAYKRLTRTIAVPAGGANVVLDQPRHRGLGLRLRRGPHGRPGRLDDAVRPHGHTTRTPATRARLARQLHPFLNPLPDRTMARAPVTRRHDRGLVRGHRRRRRLGAVGVDLRRSRKTVEVALTYVSDDVVQQRASSSTTSSSRPGRAPRPSRTTANWTAGRPWPPGWQPGQRQRLDRRHRRRHAARLGEVERLLRPPARDPGLPRPRTSARTVLERRRHRRRRPGPRLRARDPDAADLLPRLLHRALSGDTSSSTSWPTSGTATAWPSNAGATSG